MPIEQELKDAIAVYRDNLELETKIRQLMDEIENNHQRIVAHFLPYLLTVYEKWRPNLEEKAMCINLEMHHCYEVTIKRIDGYYVRAQEGQKSAYHNFYLNPELETYEVAIFIIPKWSYDEVKDFFQLKFLG